jgi:hypothetical protein
MPLLAALFLAAAAPAAVEIPPQPALTEAIAAHDAELFDLFFTAPCSAAPRFRALVADDIEFYHDKGGFNVRKADDFMAIFMKNCADRHDPKSGRSRRELVKASLRVDPVPGHGAIEVGEHLFFEKDRATGAERHAGRARFAQLWVLGADGQWRLSRVLSYAHGPAE